MKIINESDGWLTDFELYACIKSSSFIKKPYFRKDDNIQKIEEQVFQYLQDTTRVNEMSPETINVCMTKLQQYNLSMAEKLQILNLFPTTEVEIHLIIEECSDRFSREEVLDMLDIIKTSLSNPDIQKIWERIEVKEKLKNKKKMTHEEDFQQSEIISNSYILDLNMIQSFDNNNPNSNIQKTQESNPSFTNPETLVENDPTPSTVEPTQSQTVNELIFTKEEEDHNEIESDSQNENEDD